MRIDLEQTIARVDFPTEIWAWLDLVGDIIAVTQGEAFERERTYLAATSRQDLLRTFINRELGSLASIYALMRMELVYQAAAHIRLFCENVITLRYILLEPETRVPGFLEYAAIDGYRIAQAYLNWEESTAKPEHVDAMKRQLADLHNRFEKVHLKYTRVDGKGGRRAFKNWCNRSLKEQADACGADMQKLYAIGYRQLSAYVHGSAWALRRQTAYIRTGYDEDVVMIDFANLTRVLLAIWIEWMKIMQEELGWQTLRHAQGIVDRCNQLDDETHQLAAQRIAQQRETRDAGDGEDAAGGATKCVLCGKRDLEGGRSFCLTDELREWISRDCPDTDLDNVLVNNVICRSCQTLSPADRQDRARSALARELESYRQFLRRQR